MNKLLVFVIALCFPIFAFSQVKGEMGVSIGGANYLGDVASSKLFTFEQTQFSASVFGRYHLSRQFSLRGNILYTKLKGDDLNFLDENTWRADRALNFSNPVVEVSVIPEWHFLGNATQRYKARPYVFAGIGAMFTNPENNLDPKAVENEPNHYNNTHLAMPIGAGINFDINQNFFLGLEASSHFPFTDFLDGISESAGPDQKDWFIFGGVTLGYKFGKPVPKLVDTDGDGVTDDRDSCPLLAGDVKGCPDTDKDGIADIKDRCPELAGSESFSGCPDTDGDGVVDTDDTCPTIAGLLDLGGCPDQDADGIADLYDNCPNLAGTSLSKGCPDDTDGDGVYDIVDKCPNLSGALNGCPDTDADGIADNEDTCPFIPGLTGLGGCPDTDGDGIADAKDPCPNLAGKTNGCPEALASKGESAAYSYLVEEAYFRNTRAEISESEYNKLNEVARLMKANPDYNLILKGHTNDAGNLDMNNHLSMRRARKCFKYLAAKGISINRMSFKGLGATEPKYDNDTETGKQLNRRVEFAFISKK